MNRILLAGATGYLGSYIMKEMEKREYPTRVITRNKNKLTYYNSKLTEVVQAEVTKPRTLKDICTNIDVVISTVGITKQKDGLTYFDVDYHANKNLLDEALKSGVKKFMYVSVLNGEKLRHLKICEAKEKFVDALKSSGIDYCIIRPNGFFSDMTEFFNMAKKGKVYLFGDGEYRSNPIHGADLAEICVDNIKGSVGEVEVGGPEFLTQNEIAMTAFNSLDKKPKVSHVPIWVAKIFLLFARISTSSKVYGPLEFFITVLSMDMIGPRYGKITLKEYFEELVNKHD